MLFIFNYVFCQCNHLIAAVPNNEQRLLRDLFQNYSKYSRPVMRRNDQVVVTFRAKLKQIIDLVSMSVSAIKSRNSGGKDVALCTEKKEHTGTTASPLYRAK